MNRNSMTRLALYCMAVVMLIYCLLISSAIVNLIERDGINVYSAGWTTLAIGYFCCAVYIIVKNTNALVKCIAMVLILNVITAMINYSLMLTIDDDFQFVKAVFQTSFTVIDVILLVLYLSGFRQNSRRLMILLGIQAYIDLIQILVLMHFSRVIFWTITENFQVVLGLIVYALLIILLGDRRVSDLSTDRSARENTDYLFKSLGGGSMIAISEEDYSIILSDDRSSWSPSSDPAIEGERTIVAKEFRGGYEIILQKFHGSDNIRMVFHDVEVDSILNPISIDVLHVKEMEEVSTCKKVRFYGKDGMFIDLLVGKLEGTKAFQLS